MKKTLYITIYGDSVETVNDTLLEALRNATNQPNVDILTIEVDLANVKPYGTISDSLYKELVNNKSCAA